MFLERISKAQIYDFLEKTHINKGEGYKNFEFFWDLGLGENGNQITVHCVIQNYNAVVALREYSAFGVPSNLWVKYLYSLFGDEYKKCYLNKIERDYFGGK